MLCFSLFALNYPFFALNYLISASYFLKTALLLANQNRETFVCILLCPEWEKPTVIVATNLAVTGIFESNYFQIRQACSPLTC